MRRITKKREPLGQRDVARHERRTPEDGAARAVAAPGPRRVSGGCGERRVVLRYNRHNRLGRAGAAGRTTAMTTPPDDARLPRWRRVLGLPVLLFVPRSVSSGLLARRGEGEKLDANARVLVCNHLSMVEPLVLLIETRCTPVTASAFAKLPALGAVGRTPVDLAGAGRPGVSFKSRRRDPSTHKTEPVAAGAGVP